MKVSTFEELSGPVGSRFRRLGRRRWRPGEARAVRAAANLAWTLYMCFPERERPTTSGLVTSWRRVRRYRWRVVALMGRRVKGAVRHIGRDVYGRVYR